MNYKILFISEFINVSGRERRDINLIKSLVKNGYEVDIIFLQNSISLISKRFFTVDELKMIKNRSEDVVEVANLTRISGIWKNEELYSKKLSKIFESIVTDNMYKKVILNSRWSDNILNNFKFNKNVIRFIDYSFDLDKDIENFNSKNNKVVNKFLVQGKRTIEKLKENYPWAIKKSIEFDNIINTDWIDNKVSNESWYGEHITSDKISKDLNIAYVDVLGQGINESNNNFEMIFELDKYLLNNNISYNIDLITNAYNDNRILVDSSYFTNNLSNRFYYLLEKSSDNLRFVGRRDDIYSYIKDADIVVSFADKDEHKFSILESNYLGIEHYKIGDELDSVNKYFKNKEELFESIIKYKRDVEYSELKELSLSVSNKSEDIFIDVIKGVK